MEIKACCDSQLLIIGGSGFIGQHVVKKSLEQGFNTTVLSKNNCKDIDKLYNVEYLTADISNQESLLIALEGKIFDYVVNLGGYVNHSSYSNGGSEVYDVHFYGVRNLVDCLDKSKLKRFVQIGSSDEYGNNLAPQSETQREAPISLYSCAKVASTHFLQTLYKTEKFPVVILRPFLVYGPGQGKERFIPQIIKGCMSNNKFPTSRGEQLRDFCYIDDVVDGIFKALKSDRVLGKVINIASGTAIQIKHLINKIVNLIGKGRPEFGKIQYRIEENMSLYADVSKAGDLLKWRAIVPIEDGLKKTIIYYQEKQSK
jgi:nucleoside-diphosphate-sugar epimerase